MTRNEALARFSAKYGDKFDYSLVTTDIVVAKDRIQVICPEHGVFETSAANHWKASQTVGCRLCVGLGQRNSWAHVLQGIRETHGDRYDYSLVEYVGINTPIKIICREHGEFIQSPKNHRNGAGCPICNNACKRTVEQVLTAFRNVHGDKYDYSLITKHKNNKTKVSIICPNHGVFKQRPNDHITGNGCPACANRGYDQTKSGVLYYLKVCDGAAYKIGITNQSVMQRYKTGDRSKIEVLSEVYYANGYDAARAETEIKRKYKRYKWKGPDLLSSGNSELFTKDILGLDHAATRV